MSRTSARLARQFEMIQRKIPAIAGLVRGLRTRWAILIRVPLAIVLILGGIFSILPFLGIWMLPLGLMLLALDLPFLQGPVSALMIRARRRIAIWQRWWRRKRA
jgi:hypothetical protein